MAHILEELWYGNVKPINRTVERGSECEELIMLTERNEEKLNARLDGTAREIFEAYKDCSTELAQLLECETFIHGFRLGAQIIVEVLGDCRLQTEEEGR